jgi:hypothetical protein
MHSGHTMALETLWAGTPVATVPLEGSPSRVASSVLHAAQGPSGRDMEAPGEGWRVRGLEGEETQRGEAQASPHPCWTVEDCTGLGELAVLTRKEYEDLVVELAMPMPRRPKA